MDRSIKDIFRFFAVSLSIMLVVAGLNYIVDPLQIFRRAPRLTAMYSKHSRLQNAGLIRSERFDTLFMGTSLAIHFRQSDIDRVLGVKSLKLAMSGSSSREQAFVLAAALARQPKRVIWEIDDWIFHDAPDIDANTHLPADLYRGNLKGIGSYLLSGTMAREAVWIAARSVPPLKPIFARLTSDTLFKFSVPNVDDINALPPNQ